MAWPTWLKQWGPAVSAETAAVVLIAHGEAALPVLFGFWALHAVASALATAVVAALLPHSYRRPFHWPFITLFGVNFFLPVLGLAISMLGSWSALLPSRLAPARLFRRIATPEYTMQQSYDMTRLSVAATHARLFNAAAPAKARVESLLTASSSSSPNSNRLLREMLHDSEDEIRLLAYGLFERREKDIGERLSRERALLAAAEAAGDAPAARQAHHRIAELYWDLVYQSLVQGDMQLYALDQALAHAEQALKGQPADGAIWLLIGRIRLERGEYALARAALEAALANGMPGPRVLPYLAELLFIERRYTEVRALMQALGELPRSERVYALQRFWTTPADVKS